MRPLVSSRDQFLDPVPVLAAQLEPEQVVPLHIDQDQAAGSIERRS